MDSFFVVPNLRIVLVATSFRDSLFLVALFGKPQAARQDNSPLERVIFFYCPDWEEKRIEKHEEDFRHESGE